MKRKKLTENQRVYRQQQRRIKNLITRAEKRGFRFENNLTPEMPKRVTQKAIERIKNIKPAYLYSKATFLDEDTGEIISGTKGRILERQRSSKKQRDYYDSYPSLIVNRYIYYYSKFPTNISSTVIQEIIKLKNEFGVVLLAKALEELGEKRLPYLITISFPSDDAATIYIAELIEALPLNQDERDKLQEEFEKMEVN